MTGNVGLSRLAQTQSCASGTYVSSVEQGEMVAASAGNVPVRMGGSVVGGGVPATGALDGSKGGRSPLRSSDVEVVETSLAGTSSVVDGSSVNKIPE